MAGFRNKYLIDDPNTTTLLMKVEELINWAIGPADQNTVNFKMLQAILYILAKQLRLLDQKVEIRVSQWTAKLGEGGLAGLADASARSKASQARSGIAGADGAGADGAGAYGTGADGAGADGTGAGGAGADGTGGKGRKGEGGEDDDEEARMAAMKSKSDKSADGIEVVTQSQFQLLKQLVEQLQEKAAPLPSPLMPDNEKLKEDIAKGSATLLDTMQALNLNARLEAAEKAIAQMTGLLTELAAQGVIKSDLAKAGKDDDADIKAGKKGKDAKADKGVGAGGAGADGAKRTRFDQITYGDLLDALDDLKAELALGAGAVAEKAQKTAEDSAKLIKSVAEKMKAALALDQRLEQIKDMLAEYNAQVDGFDAGLTTQMASFNEQLTSLREELAAGLKMLAEVNNNAETAAVMELTERYNMLLADLDETLHLHQGLTSYQRQLSDDLSSLIDCVEMLREQKADRDEILDGLRDKADRSCLAGLLTEAQFEEARRELEARLEKCHEKFNRQDAVWMNAIQDLSQITEGKADMLQLMRLREITQDQLQGLYEKVHVLAKVLGDPKAAALTRKLCRDATCLACRVPALMDITEKSYGAQVIDSDEEVCETTWTIPKREEDADVKHQCLRWVGGSHTLINAFVSHEVAPPKTNMAPAKRYFGVGADGRLYSCAEELQPCAPCNPLPEDVPGAAQAPDGGAGDQGQDASAAEGIVMVKLTPERQKHGEGEGHHKEIPKRVEVGALIKGTVQQLGKDALLREKLLNELREGKKAEKSADFGIEAIDLSERE